MFQLLLILNPKALRDLKIRMTLSSGAIWLYALAGILSHLTIFIRGEHHLHAASYLGILISVFTSISYLQVNLHSLPILQSIIDTSTLAAAYSIAMCSSILIYRIFFHPLRHFPGPMTMRMSKVGHIFRSRMLDNHHQMDKLYKKYGDIVRTGPNELTIFKPEAYAALHGQQSKCTKAAWYDVLKPNESMHSTRVKANHGRQKRMWERAFSSKGQTTWQHCPIWSRQSS